MLRSRLLINPSASSSQHDGSEHGEEPDKDESTSRPRLIAATPSPTGKPCSTKRSSKPHYRPTTSSSSSTYHVPILWVVVMVVMELGLLLIYYQQNTYPAKSPVSISSPVSHQNLLPKKSSSHSSIRSSSSSSSRGGRSTLKDIDDGTENKESNNNNNKKKKYKKKEKEKNETEGNATRSNFLMMPDTHGNMVVIPDHDPSPWGDPRHDPLKNNTPHVDWTMHRIPYHEPTYTEQFNENYVCPMHRVSQRAPLPERLLPKLWFRTALQTNLNVLVMGDSVAVQLGELLQEGMGVTSKQRVKLRLLEEQEDHESLFWGMGSHGGGVGGWRLLHFWMQKALNKPLPENSGGGWVMDDVETLLETAKTQALANPEAKYHARRQVDVVIFRLSQPWMSWESMEPVRLMETVHMAHRLLGTTAVIFLTIPFSNNVVDHEDVGELLAKNAMLHEFAENYPNLPHALPQVKVMVLNFGHLHDELVRENAIDLGFPGVTRGGPPPGDYRFAVNTLKPRRSWYVHHIAHVCGGEWVPHLAPDCIRNNQITYDGQHICLKTFGGRFVAGVGCTLECAYHTTTAAEPASPSSWPLSHAKLRNCERQCNAQYMSLNTIPESEFENGFV